MGNKKILFICQKEYFRQAIYDAITYGIHEAFWVTSGDLKTVENALNYALSDTSFTHVVAFRPEWLGGYVALVEKLRFTGIKVIGYSTEPIPLDVQSEGDVHDDQKTRLNNLKAINNIHLDEYVHFDASSSAVLQREIIHKARFIPLPVSRHLFKIIKDERKEFDSIFLGRSTDYREGFLTLPKSVHNHLHVAHGLVDEGACLFTNRSRVAYNIHNHNYKNFETRPIINLLCGVTTVSEVLTRTDLVGIEGYYEFNSFDDFKNLFYSDLVSPDEEEVHYLHRNNFDIENFIATLS
jgi:hypothetical protein